MTSPDSIDLSLAEQLFQEMVSDANLIELCREHRVKMRKGIFTPAIVVWLMIYQRLNSRRTLSSAVQWLARQAARLRPRLHPCKRLVEERISTATGGYCQARQNMPKLVVRHVTDHLFQGLEAHIRENSEPIHPPVFVIDGTTFRLPHEKELVDRFPPGRNQHGDNHWPTMLIVAFHDAHTGLAVRPSWGPMYGPQAVSEQELARRALERLPADALVLGDGNFGIFAFAHAVQQTHRPLLLRLTEARAAKVLGGVKLQPGRRRKLVWNPSYWDRRSHPELPAGASIEGWVLVCQNPARPGETLHFFTTLDRKPTHILALYKLRWNIESDLLSLKRTVGLHQVASRSMDMVEKEILMAVSAYNLVRGVMYLAARQTGVTPRELSFSTAQDAVMVALPYLRHAPSEAEYLHELERLIQVVARAKLPHRTAKRSYPREIWGRGGHFPFRKSRPGQDTE